MANRDLTPRSGYRGLSPDERDPFTSLRRQMDRLFDDFFTPAPAETRSFSGGSGRGQAWPSVDVHETDQGYKITAELPGMEEKDVEVNLKDNTLTISGEKRSEHEEKDGERAYSERTFGRFQRTIP